MDVAELQDEVERVLRRLTLEEITQVANHLQVEVDVGDVQRQVLRNIQNRFDATEDEAARRELFRNLPVPEPYRGVYDRILNPEVPEARVDNDAGINGEDRGVPVANQQNVAVVVDGPGAGLGGNEVVPQQFPQMNDDNKILQ